MNEEGKQKILSKLEKENLLNELSDLKKGLLDYKKRQERHVGLKFSEGQMKKLDELRIRTMRKYHWQRGIISEYGGNASVKIAGINYNVFKYSLGPRSIDIVPELFTALDMAINTVDIAIRKIEAIPVTYPELEDTSVRQRPVDIKEEYGHLFDRMQLHPKVIEASRSCFITGNYRGAILDTFISLVDYVKEKTGLDLDGDNLMNQAFSFDYDKRERRITRYPIIRLNELRNQSNRDEQQGFLYLFKGAAVGIRNPKAHKLIPQSNPLYTLEYLAFASLLFRRVEEGKLEKEQT